MGQSFASISYNNASSLLHPQIDPPTQTRAGNQHLSRPEPEGTSSLNSKLSVSLSCDFQSLSLSGRFTSQNSDLSSISSSSDGCKIQESFSSDSVFSYDEKDESNVAQDSPTSHKDQYSSYKCSTKQTEVESDEYDIDDLCTDLIEEIVLPGSGTGVNVIILNVEEDRKLSEELAEHLRKEFGCRAASIETLDPLYRLCGPQSLPAVQKWITTEMKEGTVVVLRKEFNVNTLHIK